MFVLFIFENQHLGVSDILDGIIALLGHSFLNLFYEEFAQNKLLKSDLKFQVNLNLRNDCEPESRLT